MQTDTCNAVVIRNGTRWLIPKMYTIYNLAAHLAVVLGEPVFLPLWSGLLVHSLVFVVVFFFGVLHSVLCTIYTACFRLVIFACVFLSVISPELVMEVEARMKRNYMPPMMPQRKHSRHSAKPHLPTVQELQGKCCCFSFVFCFGKNWTT